MKINFLVGGNRQGNVFPWLRRPPSNTSLTWRSVIVKKMQLLGGHTPPRKYDYLAVANVLLGGQSPQEINFLDCRLISLAT
jgi:hypothetical protein